MILIKKRKAALLAAVEIKILSKNEKRTRRKNNMRPLIPINSRDSIGMLSFVNTIHYVQLEDGRPYNSL
jgi:hypothetical protein